MTREQLIDAIWDNKDAWSCPKYNCDEPEEEGNTGECCKKCAENLLVEYEKQIKAEVIDAILGYINVKMTRLEFLVDNDERLNNQYQALYHRGGMWELGNVRDELEQLKEQK